MSALCSVTLDFLFSVLQIKHCLNRNPKVTSPIL